MLSLKDLHDLWAAHGAAAGMPVRDFDLGGRRFQFSRRPEIMGVVNLSSGSWYRESVCLTAESAIRRGKVLFEQGASIVDVGAESTLAHTERVDELRQKSLLLPVVEALSKSGVLVSVETYHPAVARAALEAGAKILNLTGTLHAAECYAMAAEHQAAVILCYVQGPHVREVGDFDLQADPIPMMYEFFSRQIEQATQAGVERLFIDPGLGFYYRNLQDSAVRVRHQMKVFLNTFRLRPLGFPVCHALPHAFEYFGEEVRCAEPFFCLLAALGQTSLFRTHEVPRIRAVLETLSVW